jgi:hypothetical protein
MLVDLATAVRAAGLPVIERFGWLTRGHGQMLGVRTIVCHHTAGPPTGESPSLGVVENGRPGLEGPLAHLFLSRSGAVYIVAAGLCWHAGVVRVPITQGNEWSIGIEAEADGVSPWPPVQYAAYVRLCRALCDFYGLGYDRVMGHKEVCAPVGRKIDPAPMDMDTFRRDVANGSPGGNMLWSDKVIPDYAGGKTPPELLAADVTFGWMARNAGQAAGAATAAAHDVAVVSTKVDALSKKLDTLVVGTGPVDLDALAAKVADLLAERLAA